MNTFDEIGVLNVSCSMFLLETTQKNVLFHKTWKGIKIRQIGRSFF